MVLSMEWKAPETEDEHSIKSYQKLLSSKFTQFDLKIQKWDHFNNNILNKKKFKKITKLNNKWDNENKILPLWISNQQKSTTITLEDILTISKKKTILNYLLEIESL